MWLNVDSDQHPGQVFVAGQRVPAGTYHEIECRRDVRLEHEDILPATCNGRVATYIRRPLLWAEVRDRQKSSH